MFAVRKTTFYTFLILFILLLSSSTLAVDYTEGCCLGPFGPISPLIGSTEEGCVAPNVWQENCFALLASNPVMNTALLEDTTCCCYANTVAFVSEAAELDIDTDPADVLKVYCDAKANQGYISKTEINDPSCDAVCTLSPETKVDFEGFVVEDEGELGLSDIRIVLEFENGAKFDTTTINGYYYFTQVPSGVANIYLTTPSDHPYTCSTLISENVYVYDGLEVNFSLTCSVKPDVCIPEWVIDPWSDCYVYAGSSIRTRTITDNKDCGLPLQNSTMEVCDEQFFIGSCGDGKLNEGEQCDVNDTTSVFRAKHNNSILTSDFTCQRVFGTNAYGTGDVSCNNCVYDLSECAPACSSQCDNSDAITCACPACTETSEGRKLCGQSCFIAEPSFLSNLSYYVSTGNVYDLYDSLIDSDLTNTNLFPGIVYQLHSRDVILTWNYDATCEESLLGFKLITCQEQGTSGSCLDGTRQETFIDSPNGRSGTLTNALKKADTSYCYNVYAITLDDQLHGAYSDDELPCFNSGDNVCLRPQKSEGYNCESVEGGIFPAGCSQGGGYKDDTYGILTNLSLEVVKCESGFVCVETLDGDGAACRAVTECEKCNGLFGLYANYNLKIAIDDTSKLNCNDLQFYGAKQKVSDQIKGSGEPFIGLCYKDETLTTQPVFDTCEHVDSCYGYKSETACDNDPCMKFQDSISTCGWTSFNDELGIGVCGPVNTTNAECGRCDIDSPLGFCTEDLCQDIYGQITDDNDSVCYYNEIKTIRSLENQLKPTLSRNIDNPLLPTCVHKSNMACSFYDTKDDCMGEGADPTYNLTYKPAYDASANTNDALPSNGSNERLSESGDYFNFGNCFWDEENNLCMKNSDGYFFHSQGGDKEDDCKEGGSSTTLQCLSDNVAPVTKILFKQGYIPTYGIGEVGFLSLEVTDDKYLPEQIKTYFSIYQDDFVYPQYTLADLRANDNELLQGLISPDGIYTIAYFSKDPASNLEVIQTKPIKIDSTAPKVTVNAHTETIDAGSDIFYSDVDVIVIPDTPSHCKFELFYDDAGNNLVQPANDKEKLDVNRLTSKYVYLRDGQYYLIGFCSDDFGNKQEFSESVMVQGDQSITDSYPYGQTFSVDELDDLTFSLQTLNPATCYVSPQEFISTVQSGDEVKMTNDSAGLIHTLDYTTIGNYPKASGSYSYFVKCVFADGDLGDDNIKENDVADSISFTIDSIPPTVYLQKEISPGVYINYNEVGENWNEEKTFRIVCNDINSQTPFASAACKKITYCFENQLITDITPENFAQKCSKSIEFLGTTRTIVIGGSSEELSMYGQKYIYFFGEDMRGNNETIVHRSHLRIRSTEFPRPVLDIN